MKRNPYNEKTAMENALALIVSTLKPYPFAYIHGYVSTLGGEQRSSILLSVSFEQKSAWDYGIFENSQHAKFWIGSNGSMELISKYKTPPFRKTKVKNVDEMIKKLVVWGEKALR